MYRLTNKAINLLKTNVTLRTKVALGMGVGESAITMSLRRNKGESIANNFGGVQSLLAETGLKQDEILEVETVNA